MYGSVILIEVNLFHHELASLLFIWQLIEDRQLLRSHTIKLIVNREIFLRIFCIWVTPVKYAINISHACILIQLHILEI